MYGNVGRILAAFALVITLGLLCSCGDTAQTSSVSSQSTPAASEPAESVAEMPEVNGLSEIMRDATPGSRDFTRPEITMLEMNHENGNIIEIPQLTWMDPAKETQAGRDINKRILAFVEGYQDYLGGHPEAYTCEIQTTAHYVESMAEIVISKAFYPAYGRDPEVRSFQYNYLLEQEDTYDTITTSQLPLDEIEQQIMKAAEGDSGHLTAQTCELAAYSWADFGDIYFYEVSVTQAEGEAAVASWAYIEHSVMLNPGKIIPGADAFAYLKRAYPDLPPDFDNPTEVDSTFVWARELLTIELNLQSQDEMAWSYTTSGEGAIEEVSYTPTVRAIISKDGTSFDYPDIPGYQPFCFRGVKPGAVTLRIIHAPADRPNEPPAYEIVCEVEVLNDLTVHLSDQVISSSID